MSWFEMVLMHIGGFVVGLFGIVVAWWIIYAGYEAARLYWFNEKFRNLNKGKYSFWQIWWEQMKLEVDL